MAVKLLQVLVLVVGAAAHDVAVTWHPSKTSLQCIIPGAEKLPTRHPPPRLEEERSKPSKLYVWERDGVELNRGSSDGFLDISKRRDPEGLYQCYIKVQGGRVLGYPVNFKYAYIDKQFSVHPANASAWRGQPYALTCAIASGPAADISWHKNNKPLPHDPRYLVRDNQLLISEVRDEDAGSYKCKGTNSVTNKSRNSYNGELVVENSPEDLEVSFLSLLQETSVSVPRGGTLVLACPILGDQKTKVVWTWTAPGERTYELESEDYIQTFSEPQTGTYSCRVKGYEHLKKNFEVTVTEPASIKHPPESRQEVLASTVRFNCSVSGQPTPNVTWFKDGKELRLTQRFKIIPLSTDKSILQLLNRGIENEDAGVYQCFARNSAGVASAWGLLSVTGPKVPGPDHVTCAPLGDSDMFLSWSNLTLDVDFTILAYTIHMSLGPEGTSYPEQPVLVNNATIRVKSPLSVYGFQVRAFFNIVTRNKTIVSEYSKIITCQEQGVPINMTTVDKGILVSWLDFFRRNPGVLQWVLQYRLENSTEVLQNVTLDGKIYNYTLKVPPLGGEVRVLGTRIIPWPHQNLTLVRWESTNNAAIILGPGETVPTPINVEVKDVNPQNFTVHWQCEQDKRYTYLVCVRRVGSNRNVCSDSSITSMKVSYLDADTSYEVTVQAKLTGKAIGGDFSAVVIARTPPEDDVSFAYSGAGVLVRWAGGGARSVRVTQNITQPMELWRVLNTTTENSVEITDLDRKLPTYVMVTTSDPDQRFTVHTIKPPPDSYEASTNFTIYIIIIVAVLLVCVLTAAGVCVWHKRKHRSRSHARSAIEAEAVPKQKIVGGRLANGGGPREAGEPLLNGHVHITENPSQSKTPNGKVRKGHRYEAPFDVVRYDSGDVTLETVLDDSATLSLFDTSRRPEFERLAVSPNASFTKLPDDNMNSEITRSIELDTSKLHPTLQPNG